ncbi:MAG: serine O-acetyltransferase [Clostridiales bacterium]|jgi:serine O-acetyltransferase|nr:serine O-acetyltransferase [Clostridiales bacterium]
MFKQLLQDILTSYNDNPTIEKIKGKNPINKVSVIEMIDKLQALTFPGYFGQRRLNQDTLEYSVGELLEDLAYDLKKQVHRALYPEDGSEGAADHEAESITFNFLSKIAGIRRVLATDVEAFYDGDPAAYNNDEIILSYPGFYALTVNRLAHELYLMGVPMIPRMMTEHAHSLTGIDINPGATIGHHFFMDHGTGIVIGETTIIGDYVKIYQGVTLGALSTRGGQSLKGKKRHPTIEDRVTIYSGASILGGDTIIGEGVVIGSNAFIISSVQENTKVSIKSPNLRFIRNNREAAHELDEEDNWFYMI